MRVFIKNKLMSLGGGSDVLNEQQEPVFKVKGKVFSFTKKKRMYNMEGKLLYTIRNRFWNLFSDKVFIYDENKHKVATIKKNKFSFTAKYQIQDCVDNMSIDGKVFGRTSKIMRNEKEAGVITRDINLVRDAFTLDAEEKDIPFFTAIVIAFDNIKDKKFKDND